MHLNDKKKLFEKTKRDKMLVSSIFFLFPQYDLRERFSRDHEKTGSPEKSLKPKKQRGIIKWDIK